MKLITHNARFTVIEIEKEMYIGLCYLNLVQSITVYYRLLNDRVHSINKILGKPHINN